MDRIDRPMAEDKTLVCAECSGNFVFTAGEQEFYEKQGFQNIPKRCQDCRSKRKAQSRRPSGGGGGRGRSEGGGGGGGGGGERPGFPADCTRCGTHFSAPFQPKEGLPILCRECFQDKKNSGAR
mgnify:CR=1 FL=1